MTFKMKIVGLEKLAQNVDRLIEANSDRGVLRNIHTLAEFGVRRVRERTPGSGYLRSHWDATTIITRTANGVSARCVIANTLADKGVYYLSTDGTVKKKLQKYPSNAQQKYREVIGYLDGGTKSHFVAPKRKKFLSWWGTAPHRDSSSGEFSGGSNPTFSRGHFVRGIRPYGMLTKGAQDIRSLIESLRRDHTRNVIKAWD